MSVSLNYAKVVSSPGNRAGSSNLCIRTIVSSLPDASYQSHQLAHAAIFLEKQPFFNLCLSPIIM